MRILFVTCALLASISCLSQNISIKLPLLAPVDEVSFPTLQCGIEFGISKKISWYNEAGIKYRKSYYEMADTNFVASRGFKVKSEIRYYPGKGKNVYFAVNGFYTKDHHNTEAGYYHAGDSSDYRIDNFSAEKTVKGLNVITGKKYKAWGRFSFDLYAGIGVRFVCIKHNNIEVDHEKDILRRRPDLNIPDNRVWTDVKGGKYVLPNFSTGIRLTCSLNKS